LVAEADDFPGLIAAVEEHRPDRVITDARMPPPLTNEGIRATERSAPDIPKRA